MLRMTNDYKEEKITTIRKFGNLKFENVPRILLFQKHLLNYSWHQKYLAESFKVFLNYF